MELRLNEIVAIVMLDTVLVAHKDRVQDAKKVVTKLKENRFKQAEVSTKNHTYLSVGFKY